MRMGLDDECGASDDTDKEEPGDALEQVQRQLATPRQCFRLKLMNDLFNSPFLSVERCL